MKAFPEGFMWGASTAGHQIEGGNLNSDNWALEWLDGSRFVEPSGDACDSYHRYAEDISLLAAAGLGAYRFSVEWSRIEPEQGWFSRAELDHYRRMIGTCLEHGVTPIVSYNHFTTPYWFSARGGWSADASDELFGRYAERLTAHIGDLVPWVCTLNEPNLMAMIAATGFAPIGDRKTDHGGPSEAERNEIARLRSISARTADGWKPGILSADLEVMARAHRRAVDAIRSGPGDAKVGWTLALVDYQLAEGGEHRLDQSRTKGQLDWLSVSSDDDFVGVQTYSRELIGADGIQPRPTDADLMLTGWEVYPDALEHTVRLAAETARVPVLVTENGCATADDQMRISYTRSALDGLARCIEDGVDVRGYLHWSLLDNYEWASGFAISFGLIAVDRQTFARTPKPSLFWLGDIAQRNGLPL